MKEKEKSFYFNFELIVMPSPINSHHYHHNYKKGIARTTMLMMILRDSVL